MASKVQLSCNCGIIKINGRSVATGERLKLRQSLSQQIRRENLIEIRLRSIDVSGTPEKVSLIETADRIVLTCSNCGSSFCHYSGPDTCYVNRNLQQPAAANLLSNPRTLQNSCPRLFKKYVLNRSGPITTSPDNDRRGQISAYDSEIAFQTLMLDDSDFAAMFSRNEIAYVGSFKEGSLFSPPIDF